MAGGAGQNMIGFSFPACGRGNSARRALPGESVGEERWVGTFGFFTGCRPDLLGVPSRASPLDGRGLDILQGSSHPPKPSPRGEGGPAKPGRMRGRFGTQPFLVEKRRSPSCRLNEVFLLPRWATRSPPHPSPPVTASPQGEASGLCSPTRKSAPNQGTYMGYEIAQRPLCCAPLRQNERVGPRGPYPRGGGGPPPATLCVRAFS